MLLINLTDCSHANCLLHIINQLLILTEEKIQGIQPYLLSFLSRWTRSNLCNKILRIMWLFSCKPFSKVIGCIWRINEILVLIQVRYWNSNHRLCRICCRYDVFVITSLLNKFQISLSTHQHVNQRNQFSVHLFQKLLWTSVNRFLRYACILQSLFNSCHFIHSILKLQIQEFLNSTNRHLLILSPTLTIES